MKFDGVVLTILMASLMLCTPSGFADDAAPAPEAVITSGCEYDYPPFCIVGEKGRAGGFSVELLRAALATMDRGVTFRVGKWAEVKGLLEKGEIEALPLVGRTPERESIFDFTFPYLSLHGAIVVREETTDIHDLSGLKGRRVAVMAGDNAEEFLRRTDAGLEIQTTPTFVEALRDLSRGQYDAVVIQRLLAHRLIQEAGITNLRIVGQPLEEFRQDFCFAVRKGDPETLSLLNEGLALVMADGTFRHLQRKWFASLELPSDDQITIGTELGYQPYSFLDENGRPAGFNVDLTRVIAENVGLDAEIKIGPWGEIRKALEAGVIDAISGMFYSEERDRLVDFSPPYAIVHQAVFARRETPEINSADDLRGKAIIVMDGDIMDDYVREEGITRDPVRAETQAAALRLLASGKGDYALVARLPGLYWIKKLNLTNLRIAGPLLRSSKYCYAVKEGNVSLLSRLSEGLAISKETNEYSAIYDKWLGVLEPRGMGAGRIVKYAAIIIIPLLVIISVMILWSRTLRKQVAQRTGELEREITERDRTATALRESEVRIKESKLRYQKLFTNSLASIFLIDPETRVIEEVNPAGLELTGFSREELVGSPLARIFPGTRNETAEILEKVVEEGLRIIAKIVTTASGEERFVDAAFSYYTYADRPLIQMITLDITERKAAEGALELLRENLEIRVAEQTKELEERVEESEKSRRAMLYMVEDLNRTSWELKSAQESLVRSERLAAIGELAGSVAHELRNSLGVLTNVVSYLGVAVPSPDETLRRNLGHMVESVGRANKLVSDLLDYSREAKPVKSVFSICELVDEVLANAPVPENIEIERHCPEDESRYVFADRVQISHVIENLVKNAVEAMTGSEKSLEGGKLTISCRPGDEGKVIFRISDTGVGISPGDMGRVFDPLFTRKSKGIGLGLSLSRRYAGLNGGELTAESEEGKGSTFTLVLPAGVNTDLHR